MYSHSPKLRRRWIWDRRC